MYDILRRSHVGPTNQWGWHRPSCRPDLGDSVVPGGCARTYARRGDPPCSVPTTNCVRSIDIYGRSSKRDFTAGRSRSHGAIYTSLFALSVARMLTDTIIAARSYRVHRTHLLRDDIALARHVHRFRWIINRPHTLD